MEAYQSWLNQMIEDGRLEKRVSLMQLGVKSWG